MASDHHKIEVRLRACLTPVALVMLRKELSHGYELIERLEEFGLEQINGGTLYRTLRQSEKEGLCESEWENLEGGPARRMYYTTQAGDTYLNAWVQACKGYRRVIAALSQAYASRMTIRSSEHGGL